MGIGVGDSAAPPMMSQWVVRGAFSLAFHPHGEHVSPLLENLSHSPLQNHHLPLSRPCDQSIFG